MYWVRVKERVGKLQVENVDKPCEKKIFTKKIFSKDRLLIINISIFYLQWTSI